MRELAIRLANQRCRRDAGIGEMLASAEAIQQWLKLGRLPEQVIADCTVDRKPSEDRLLSQT